MKYVPNNINDALDIFKIDMRTISREGETDEKKEEAFVHLFKSPTTLPLRVMMVATLGGLGLGWATKKLIAKKVNAAQIARVEKIKKELLKTHTPAQKDLYEEIQKLESEKGSLTDTFAMRLVSKLAPVGPVSAYLGLIQNDFSKNREKPKIKYLAIITRKYEDSLNNYQLSVYKTLFESQMELLSRIRATKLIVQVGAPLIALAISSKLTMSDERTAAAKEYIKSKKV